MPSPLGDEYCVSQAISKKISALRRMGDKFTALSAHDALLFTS